MKFYKTDWFLRIASVVAAIIIWFYVVYQENPTIERWISNIPVVQKNLSQDFENGKLVIMSISTDKVDAKVSGRRRIMSSMNSASGTATMDMSKITEAGTYEIPINVDFSIDGIDVIQLRPNRCTVVVDRVVTEERPITIIRKGATDDGYTVDDIVATPDVIKLSGPKSAIDKVETCSITIDLTDIKEDVKGLYKIKLYDDKGNEISNNSITKNIEYSDVTCSVSAVKNVTIRPILNGATNSNGDIVVATVEPSKITVKGKNVVLESTEELLTEMINVSNVFESKEIKCKVLLKDGLSFTDENMTYVTVKLDVKKADITE